MENITKLNNLIEQAVSDGHENIPEPMLREILTKVESRVDMYIAVFYR